MRFKVKLTADSGKRKRDVDFDSDFDATSVLEQKVYDTIAEEDEWIHSIVRVPDPDLEEAS